MNKSSPEMSFHLRESLEKAIEDGFVFVADNLLALASRRGNLEVVEYAIRHGADIHRDNEGALRGAAYFGHLDIVKFLTESGADIEEWSRDGNELDDTGHFPVSFEEDTAIQSAAWNGHLDVVNFLIKSGASKRSIDAAFRAAAPNGHIDVVKVLVKSGADVERWGSESVKWGMFGNQVTSCLLYGRNPSEDTIKVLKTTAYLFGIGVGIPLDPDAQEPLKRFLGIDALPEDSVELSRMMLVKLVHEE